MLELNLSIIESWKSCDGDNTNLINYDLNQGSKILELGGYNGTWVRKMISRYDPFVFVIEPIPAFFQNIKNEFSENPKFKILNVGVSCESRDGVMYLDNDSTTEHVSNDSPINVRFETMSNILEKFGIEDVDLLQINIEGSEYDLLEDLIKTGTINKFKNIQVQFHMGMDNYDVRRDLIHANLKENGFAKKFDYPFIWEGWSKM